MMRLDKFKAKPSRILKAIKMASLLPRRRSIIIKERPLKIS